MLVNKDCRQTSWHFERQWSFRTGWTLLSITQKVLRQQLESYGGALHCLNLVLCRCSWGLWWCNRRPETSQSTTDIWSAVWRSRRNSPGVQHTRIPGSSGRDRPQQGGVIMGHCHRPVRLHGRLQHRQVSGAVLWPSTGCLSVWRAGLKAGNHTQTQDKHTDVSKQMWSQQAPLIRAQRFVCRICFWDVADPAREREPWGAGGWTLAPQYCEISPLGRALRSMQVKYIHSNIVDVSWFTWFKHENTNDIFKLKEFQREVESLVSFNVSLLYVQ